MGTIWQDVKFGARMLARSPGFTAIAVLTLALGIGANTAIFSLVNTVLLKPLPYGESDRLVIALRKNPGVLRTTASYPDFEDWQKSGALEKAAAIVGRGFYLETAEGLQALRGARVSEDFFDVLRVKFAAGRGFLPDEVRHAENVAVISHQAWTTYFARDPEIVGKDLRLRGLSLRVVGVLSADYLDPVSPQAIRQVYAPLVVTPEERVARNSHWLQVIGRLAPGTSLEAGRAEIEAVSERAQREANRRDVRSLSPFTLNSLLEHHVGKTKRALWLLFGAVGFVLLIVCVNLSNLMLSRVTARQHELVVRAALGASPRRLASQLLTESVLMSLVGRALALVFVVWTMDLVKAISPVDIPRVKEAGLDPRVFGFTLLVSVVAGMLTGLVPVLRGTRMELLTVLKQAAGSVGAVSARWRGGLLVAEVALTIVLMVGATLAVASFQRLLRVDAGFQTRNLLTVTLVNAGEWKQPAQHAFLEQLLDRVRALPGVEAVGVVDNLPFSGAWSQFSGDIEGYGVKDARPEMRGKTIEFQQGVVGGDYFQVMGIPLKAGRFFDPRDAAPGAASIILSESLARTIWGDADPLGRMFSDNQTKDARVVGVVGNVRHFGPDTPLVQTLYRPLAQREAWGLTLVVATDADATSLAAKIREHVRDLDRSVIVQQAQTMDEVLRRRTAAQRFLAVLLGSFGGVALVLAVMGIYGVLAYSVAQRTREIGVRMALGAQTSDVLRLILGQGAMIAGIGVVVGVGIGFALTRLAQSQMAGLLFNVKATDPVTFAGTAIVLGVVALIASYLPARRATRVEPMVALRYE